MAEETGYSKMHSLSELAGEIGIRDRDKIFNVAKSLEARGLIQATYTFRGSHACITGEGALLAEGQLGQFGSSGTAAGPDATGHQMADEMPPTFVAYAAEILADTDRGLSGPQFVKATLAYSVQWDVPIPHPTYPFGANVPNKRTALYENLMVFPPAQRYRIIRELCEHPELLKKSPQAAETLKVTLVARYGHLADEALGSELDGALVERTQHFLGPFPDALGLYEQAVQKHANGVFLRNVLDDLRLALELLLKSLLGNDKSLENQIPLLGEFIKQRGGSLELANMFVKLVDYYTKYQNSYVKHDDAVIEEEVEFIIEITSSFMKHLVRLSYKRAV